MPQQFDPSKPFSVAPAPGVSAVSPDEPGDYWSGALKGAAEGVTGGAKGFVEGMLHSPASFVKGLVSLLTTNPATTVKDAVAAIERLPDAIKQAGADPEAWGKGVGDVTGQTMIGMAAPSGVKPAIAGAGRGATMAGQGLEALGDSTAMRRVGTYGAAGAAMHGDLGTAFLAATAPTAMKAGGRVLQGAGKFLTGAPEAAAVPVSAADELKAGASMSPARFAELLKQVPPNERAAIMTARQDAVAAAPAAETPLELTQRMRAESQAANPAPVAPEAPPAPQSAPVAAPEPAPATPQGVPMSRPAAMQAALKAFSEAQEAPRPAEVANAASLIAKGAAPEQALKVVLGNRGTAAASPAPAPSPAEAFNAKYGLAQPTVDQTKFPKGMRGKVGSAQSVTVPPEETPAPQELLQGGAAEADFARQYAAQQSAIRTWTPESGGELFHGTTNQRVGALGKQSEVYLTTTPTEASGYAQGKHAPGELRGDPLVLKIKAEPGKTVDITREISDAMMNDDFDPEWLDARIAAARKAGNRYVTYDHPSFEANGPEQRVIVALHPKT